jgi:hypothetical protein
MLDNSSNTDFFQKANLQPFRLDRGSGVLTSEYIQNSDSKIVAIMFILAIVSAMLTSAQGKNMF